MFDIFLDYISQILTYLFIWSNIGLSIMFFLLANHLINASQKLEFNQNNLKLRIKKIDIKCKYSVFFLGLLSVLSLFHIFQLMLSICFNFFPYSPFIDLMYFLRILGSINFETDTYQLMLLAIATVSFLSFILSILGLYSAIFKKLLHGEKSKGLIYFIGFFALSFFFGFPLMLNFISPSI